MIGRPTCETCARIRNRALASIQAEFFERAFDGIVGGHAVVGFLGARACESSWKDLA